MSNVILVPLVSLTVVRNGGAFTPPVGKAFPFTKGEKEEFDAAGKGFHRPLYREPENESQSVDESQSVLAQEAAAREAAQKAEAERLAKKAAEEKQRKADEAAEEKQRKADEALAKKAAEAEAKGDKPTPAQKAAAERLAAAGSNAGDDL